MVRDVRLCKDGVNGAEECLSAWVCDGGELEFAMDFSEFRDCDGGCRSSERTQGVKLFGGFVWWELDCASDAVDELAKNFFPSGQGAVGD